MEQQKTAPDHSTARTLPVELSPEAIHNLTGLMGLLMKIDSRGRSGRELNEIIVLTKPSTERRVEK
jgi:hypothetical protein